MYNLLLLSAARPCTVGVSLEEGLQLEVVATSRLSRRAKEEGEEPRESTESPRESLGEKEGGRKRIGGNKRKCVSYRLIIMILLMLMFL